MAVASFFFLIYIFCLNVSIFRTKIQFYSVWERVRELAVSLFVCLKLPATHYYYSSLPLKQVFQNLVIPTFISFLFFFWKIFFFIYIYISSLAWKFQQSWWELVFYYEKKTRYSTSLGSSTINKYSISIISSTTLLF